MVYIIVVTVTSFNINYGTVSISKILLNKFINYTDINYTNKVAGKLLLVLKMKS